MWSYSLDSALLVEAPVNGTIVDVSGKEES
jgi:hypothetical protein